MRLGLAGTGRIGAFHATTLRQLADVVVADADPARARQTADQLGVEFAADVDALFAARLDGLVIAAATDAHPELILRAVAAGLPVFCEKPVARDIEGTLRVIDRIAATDVPVQIGFQRRFDAGYTSARDAVSKGKLGWLHTLRANTCDPAPPPAEYIATSGGFFRDCSVHDFDVIRWVTGREVVEAYAVGANRGAGFFAAADDVASVGVVLTMDDGAIALVSGTRYNAAGYDVRLEVLGAQGSLVVGLDDDVPLRSAEPGVAWPVGSPYPGFMARFRAAYQAELAAFAALVADGGQSPCTGADALEAFYVAEACDRSRREHRPVTIAEVRG
ncbi:MAG TPA: Gfo/Idh/MocA family oxidoreductase [Pseudonocardiaceae bacterium]|jgi:myo-inositol 2-dehydrogenase/D-chiro-inositol 1-dehydrogenase|nr:Gfo/Idh/MocA family oxidoreductase [Pseudonocardiaceae bacterium]